MILSTVTFRWNTTKTSPTALDDLKLSPFFLSASIENNQLLVTADYEYFSTALALWKPHLNAQVGETLLQLNRHISKIVEGERNVLTAEAYRNWKRERLATQRELKATEDKHGF